MRKKWHKLRFQIIKRLCVAYLCRGHNILIGAVYLLMGGCTGVPAGVEPVTDFEQTRYLGSWYEIARLDHRFERGLREVTATYSTNPDGSIAVLNRGFDVEDAMWRKAEGVARFVGSPDVAHLKVSFFGPFFGSYIVFELGENYDYAFVSGFNHNYLWLLAREPQINDQLRSHFLERISALGFDRAELIWLDNRAFKESVIQ